MSLKIESGMYKGLSFDTVSDKKTRYTPAQLRRTLMNIFDFSDSKLLEVFGGSGSVSFEIISNGALSSVIIEQNSRSVSTIIKNAKNLNLSDKIKVVKSDYRIAFEKLKSDGEKFDYIFADPPFNLNFCNEFLNITDSCSEIINTGGFIILEHSKHESVEKVLKNFIHDESRNYGDIDIEIFIKK
ncbi:MAG: RsmD family RNA methyltransferase [Thermotogae bacterium]|nr:RsmD family RNA methyltransferase [Thermotogota bacterium]HOO75297.1 RsmD family RNA methyltransferase [Tepiditoga sp.]